MLLVVHHNDGPNGEPGSSIYVVKNLDEIMHIVELYNANGVTIHDFDLR